MAQLVLRLVKGSPITDQEMDSNFTNLNRDTFLSVNNSTPWTANTDFAKGEILNVLNRFYLVTESGTTSNVVPTHTSGTIINGTVSLQATQPVHYSAKDVLDKIKTLDGINSGLDADLIHGLTPLSILPAIPDKSSIVSRDSNGDSTFNNLFASRLNVSTLSVTNGLGTAGQVLVNTGSAVQWQTIQTTPVITADNTNATRYLTFVDGIGTQNLKIDNTTTPLTYNPSSNSITVNLVGNVTGNVTGVASGNPKYTANTFTEHQTVPNENYDTSAWLNNFTVPTKHAVRGVVEGVNSRFVGSVFWWIGNTAPAGAMVVPLVPTNLSRTTYSRLHEVVASLGYPWGVGDGITTFGSPYLRYNYTIINANGDTGSESVGQVISHNHGFVGARAYNVSLNDITITVMQPNNGGHGSPQNPTTANTGGPANLAAGVRFTLCMWI